MALANLNSKEENSKYVSDIFEKMYMFSFSMLCFLIPLTKVVTQVILSADYKTGSVYIGFLYLGAIFQGFSTFASVGYLQKKKTAKVSTSSAAGAIMNLLMDLLLIKTAGLFAASLSTYAGFFIMWLVRMYGIRNDWPIKINKKKFAAMTVIATAMATITIWTKTRMDIVIAGIFGIYFLILNRSYIALIINKIKR